MTTKAQAHPNPAEPEPAASFPPAECRRGGTLAGERRDSVRHPVSDPIWWKGQDSEQFQQGWLIERSFDGAAFLARGRVTLLQGTSIQVSTSDPTDIGFRIDEGLVTRMQHIHADLFLVAAQLKTTG